MATPRPSFERMQPSHPEPEEKEVFSGSLKSQLSKYSGGDMRLRAEDMPVKKLANALIKKFPAANLEKVIALVKLAPSMAERTALAQELLDAIEAKPMGVLRAPDQEQALEDCIEEIKKKKNIREQK